MALLSRFVLIGAMGGAAIGVVGCSANIHDNTVSVDATLDFKVDSTVNVNQLKPGDTVAVNMTATGVALVDPNTTPTTAQASTAAYFNIYLDDVNSPPILATASTSVSVKIPPATPPGMHQLICRLQKHDGTPTDQEQSVEINVMASASVSIGAKDGG